MRHAAGNPCYLCYRLGLPGQDRDWPKDWSDEVNHPWKAVCKKSTIIKEQSKDVNDQEISYQDVAKLHNVNTASWSTVTRRCALVMILAQCVKLEFGVDQTEVGTTCKAADCVTPEKYKPAPEEEAEPAEPSVVFGMRKNIREKSETRQNNRSFPMKREPKIAHFMKNTLSFQKMRNWYPNQSHCGASGSTINSLKHFLCF